VQRELAVSVVRHYLCEKRRKFRLSKHRKRKWEYSEEAYTEYLCRKLINDIYESEEDPILTVRRLYRFLDDILTESDESAFKTHSECSRMLNIVGGILKRLHAAEKENAEV